MTGAKICGLKTPETLEAAIAGGARWAGFMAVAKSPRYLAPEAAAALAARGRGRIETVAVVSDADDALLAALQAAFAPDWIQLHGRETPARTAAARRFARKGVIKALGIAGAEDLAQAAPFEGAADMFLFDAKPPAGADRAGGHGLAFDWRILQGRRFARPWMLSGGLTPENVAAAIAESAAPAVDVSSGVETAPGIKDAGRIAAFLDSVKRA
ncbi:MAG: phosphoribosylanthranilate isomerase [Hyphomonadaceae bacterium]